MTNSQGERGFLKGIQDLGGALAAMGVVGSAAFAAGTVAPGGEPLKLFYLSGAALFLGLVCFGLGWAVRRPATGGDDQPEGPIDPVDPIPPDVFEGTFWRRKVSEAEQLLAIRPVTSPIIAFGNLKGGVGKTTLAANVGAYFAVERGKRVLFVDLDYQGTLSEILLRQAGLTEQSNRVAGALSLFGLSGDHADFQSVVQRLNESIIPCGPNMGQAKILTANSELDKVESAEMFKWALLKSRDDARYRLARLLRSEEIQSQFDLIVLDLAPRFSFGVVNGLIAATHVVIPTVLDQPSAEAALRFGQRLRSFDMLWPSLVTLGVYATLTTYGPSLTPDEIQAANFIDDGWAKDFGHEDIVNRQVWVPDTAEIQRRAAVGVAALHSSSAKQIFWQVGNSIRERTGL